MHSATISDPRFRQLANLAGRLLLTALILVFGAASATLAQTSFPGTSNYRFGRGAGGGASGGMTGPSIGQSFGGGLPGGASSLAPDQMAAIAQRLGLSLDDLNSLRSEASNGGLTSDEIQRLCLRL